MGLNIAEHNAYSPELKIEIYDEIVKNEYIDKLGKFFGNDWIGITKTKTLIAKLKCSTCERGIEILFSTFQELIESVNDVKWGGLIFGDDKLELILCDHCMQYRYFNNEETEVLRKMGFTRSSDGFLTYKCDCGCLLSFISNGSLYEIDRFLRNWGWKFKVNDEILSVRCQKCKKTNY